MAINSNILQLDEIAAELVETIAANKLSKVPLVKYMLRQSGALPPRHHHSQPNKIQKKGPSDKNLLRDDLKEDVHLTKNICKIVQPYFKQRFLPLHNSPLPLPHIQTADHIDMLIDHEIMLQDWQQHENRGERCHLQDDGLGFKMRKQRYKVNWGFFLAKQMLIYGQLFDNLIFSQNIEHASFSGVG